MTHPFLTISSITPLKLFFILLAACLLLLIVLGSFPLKPNIISFELNARQVLENWHDQEPEKQPTKWALLSLGLDFLFIVVYSNFLGFLCIWTAQGLPSNLKLLFNIGIIVAWGQWLAAILDVIENIALITILFTEARPLLALIAKWSAIPKFGLIILGLSYSLIAKVISWK